MSFDANEQSPCHPHGLLATPSTPRLNASEVSTPIISQQKVLNFPLFTPPLLQSNEPGASLNDGSAAGTDAPGALLSFPSNQYRFTPSIFNGHHDALEPPAWKPPEADEVEYTDAWNNTFNNQHHFLQPAFPKDDSSFGSNLTNNSLVNKIIISNAPNALRPRGLSLSIADSGSIGSCPPTRRGCAQHHRISSLPVSFFTSTPQQAFQSEQDNQSQSQMNKQYLNALQSTKQRVPYELYSHYNQSQVQADGAMGGLYGILLDLYMVDRSVDSAAAKILATKVGGGSGVFRQNGDKSYTEKPRRTSLGTLNDIQCILELHKVDKIVDRFKQDLQMPEFFEEDAWEGSVLKDLRSTDVEMEEYAIKNRSKKEREETGKVRYEFNPVNGEDGGDHKGDQDMGAENNILFDESFVADHDTYQFFDPHEVEVLQANSYQYSHVSASIHDDLHDIIDLLRTDLEVSGASRLHKEMEMIRPLLEIDHQMNKSKERSDTRVLWDADLKALYLTDLEVDGAKRKCALVPHKGELAINFVNQAAESSNSFTKLRDPLSPVESTKQSNNQEAPTYSPLPPLAPVSSPQTLTKRAIFSAPGKVDANMTPAATTTKRSIFSREEKSAAATKCTFQSRTVIPGTTTVVLAKGGEMIDDIPVGKVVMR
ncbi:hypothetical protein ACHAW5_002801 [Stephanodiscus triporus]|uniref:Uncharacterized protein n=1 Tax=Stephanodiscus triporus TaxID=2934178 RepID=A0ABD3Q5P2_9STRA